MWVMRDPSPEDLRLGQWTRSGRIWGGEGAWTQQTGIGELSHLPVRL
jgi:hypothetical protein